MKIERFFNPFFFSQISLPLLFTNPFQIPISYIMSTFIENEIIDTIVSLPPIKAQRKRRTSEEIIAAKADKEQKKQEKDLKQEQKRQDIVKKNELKQRYSSPLVPGTSIYAIAAMTIFSLCRSNMPRVNLAFRQMIASRLIFPPKKNINKFATGGIAEECLSQLFCHLGLECSNVSEESNVIDLAIQVPISTPTEIVDFQVSTSAEIVDFQVSLKNSGKISAQPILENYRGQKRQEIRPLPPTFIVYTEMDIKRVRIVYLDEEIIRQGYSDLSDEEFHREIYLNGDSNLTFKSGFLAKFIPRLPAEYIVNAEYPTGLDNLNERNFAKLALDEVVRQLGGDTK